MKIVIDGMGGDNAPKSNVEGIVNAIKEYGVDIIVTGDKEILEKLEAAVLANKKADSEGAKKIAKLHKEWLMISLPNYNAQMHKGIAAMYVADERFTKYYDKNVEGCAALLSEAVKYWI